MCVQLLSLSFLKLKGAWYSILKPPITHLNAWWPKSQARTILVNAQTTHKSLCLYHAWSWGLATKKRNTFHHFEYKMCHIPCVWINIRSKHNAMHTTCLSINTKVACTRFYHASNACKTYLEAKASKLMKYITHEACTTMLKWSNHIWTNLRCSKTMANTH